MNTEQPPQDASEASSSGPQDHTNDSGAYDPLNQKRLLRRSDGPIGGVATGLAEYMGFDPAIGRMLFLLAGLTTGPAVLLAYGAAWAVMPARDGAESPVDRVIRSDARIGGVSA